MVATDAAKVYFSYGKNGALKETSLRYKKFEWNKTNQQCPRLELRNYVYIIERIPGLHIIVKYDVQKNYLKPQSKCADRQNMQRPTGRIVEVMTQFN